MRGVVEYSSANRLLCELSRLEIECGDCGRTGVLDFKALQRATFGGTFSYGMLASKLFCSECPPRPRPWRRLALRPTWRESPRQTMA